MTQTIKNCNEIPVGKTYPVEHLRTAESIEQLCEHVDAGHPIAGKNGVEVFCFSRLAPNFFGWYQRYLKLDILRHEGVHSDDVLLDIKLAPLAYRNGRPLHLGDEIELFVSGDYLRRTSNLQSKLYKHYEWRFADEVA